MKNENFTIQWYGMSKKNGCKVVSEITKGVTEKGIDIFRFAQFYKFNDYTPMNIYFQNYNGRYWF